MSEEFIKKAERKLKRKSQITEKSIEDGFVDYAKSRGCWAIKLVLLSGRGWPDRTVLAPAGRLWFVEFKRKGKLPTKLQRSIQERIELLGFVYIVADAPGIAERHLDEMLDK